MQVRSVRINRTTWLNVDDVGQRRWGMFDENGNESPGTGNSRWRLRLKGSGPGGGWCEIVEDDYLDEATTVLGINMVTEKEAGETPADGLPELAIDVPVPPCKPPKPPRDLVWLAGAPDGVEQCGCLYAWSAVWLDEDDGAAMVYSLIFDARQDGTDRWTAKFDGATLCKDGSLPECMAACVAGDAGTGDAQAERPGDQPKLKHVGWFDPVTLRFCTVEEKRKQPGLKAGYMAPALVREGKEEGLGARG